MDNKDFKIDPTKHYAKIGGRTVEYTRLSHFKDTYASHDYLGRGHVYISHGNNIMSPFPNNRDILHFWK